MMKSVLFVAFVASASAFAPLSTPRVTETWVFIVDFSRGSRRPLVFGMVRNKSSSGWTFCARHICLLITFPLKQAEFCAKSKSPSSHSFSYFIPNYVHLLPDSALCAKHVNDKAAKWAKSKRPRKSRPSDINRAPIDYAIHSYQKPAEYDISSEPAAPMAKPAATGN